MTIEMLRAAGGPVWVLGLGRSGQAATGSGLGLAIVRSVAQRHHAGISLDETPGGGLTVRVSFPALPAAH